MIDKEYNITYNFDNVGLTDNGEDDLICKKYDYVQVFKSKEMFKKYSTMRYDGCPMSSITLFGYTIYWGNYYEWLDLDDEQFHTLLNKRK